MVERRREDETPISPRPDSPAPEIFSTKKIFFLNSSWSGSGRSEIPHIESDYCPRDQVSRRLFHNSSESCDCDCASDGCWGCLRRNKQCFFKVFVLVLSIVLVLLLFGSLSYNLTRNKVADESLEFEIGTKWVSHYHEYSTSEDKKVPKVKATASAEGARHIDLPVPVHEHLDDYDSGEDIRRVNYEGIDVTSAVEREDGIEPIFFSPLSNQNVEFKVPTLFIYDEREPPRVKRSVSSRSEVNGNDLAGRSKPERRGRFFRETSPEKEEEPVFEELNQVQEGMEIFWKSFFNKGRTVFEPFSLTTPVHSTSVPNQEYLTEKGFESLSENGFLSGESRWMKEAEDVKRGEDEGYSPSSGLNSSSDGETWNGNREGERGTKAESHEENSVYEDTSTTEGAITYKWMTETLSPSSIFSSTEGSRQIETPETSFAPRYEEEVENFTEALPSSVSDIQIEEKISFYTTSARNMLTGEPENPIKEETKNEEGEIFTATETKTVSRQESERKFDAAKKTVSDGGDFSPLSNMPLIQVSVPFPGLFAASRQDDRSHDAVKGISLAEAIDIKKEKRKHLLLNSRVVGGSSDVRLPTGPDVAKPFVNAFESLKTNQQLSFTPSAASQYILPYQMCLFASPFLGPRLPTQGAQPRTFSFGASPLISSIFDKDPSPKTPSFQPPSQHNFLSLNINNYGNAPPQRHLTSGPSAGPFFNFPSQQQFSFPNGGNVPHRQPIFCTYLQPPQYQFPTVPGTADFSHAKCVHCQDESHGEVLRNRNTVFHSGGESLCSGENIACVDGSACIPLGSWCDNEVNCRDASDEAFCSCRERVARERLCDGYVDCPHGEDEAGCFDCPKTAFSCDSAITPESCISLSKRCDGRRDCATGADEAECSALFFYVRQNDSYHVPQADGYLHRNWKGDWFPVCVELGGNDWAKEACLGELGFLPLEVEVSLVPVPGNFRGPFIVHQKDGSASLQDHCKGHVTTRVKCPSMKCGTRVEFHNLLESVEGSKEDDGWRAVSQWSHLRGRRQIRRKERTSQSEFEKSKLKREETGRVVGGRESEPRAWPWAIAVYKDGAFHCGGVILDENWVMTAAHCMEQYWKHFYEVRGGMLRRFSFSAMEQSRVVSHVIIHENYDQTIMSNDIALLRLQKPFHFNRWVRPACLPSPQDEISNFASGPAPGTRCIAVGWGALRERGIDPDQLREVEIPIMTRCKHKEDLVGEEICAGKIEGGKDTCQGDSGGPLLCRDSKTPASWYVAGVVSHGEGCARPGEPGAYTRISLFIDWITANANDFHLPSVKPLGTCPGLRCRSGTRLCIPLKWVCNGFTDCLEAEDESNCTSASTVSALFNERYSQKFKYFASEDINDGVHRGKSFRIFPVNSSVIDSDITKLVAGLEDETAYVKQEMGTSKKEMEDELRKNEEKKTTERLPMNFEFPEEIGDSRMSDGPLMREEEEKKVMSSETTTKTKTLTKYLSETVLKSNENYGTPKLLVRKGGDDNDYNNEREKDKAEEKENEEYDKVESKKEKDKKEKDKETNKNEGERKIKEKNDERNDQIMKEKKEKGEEDEDEGKNNEEMKDDNNQEIKEEKEDKIDEEKKEKNNQEMEEESDMKDKIGDVKEEENDEEKKEEKEEEEDSEHEKETKKINKKKKEQKNEDKEKKQKEKEEEKKSKKENENGTTMKAAAVAPFTSESLIVTESVEKINLSTTEFYILEMLEEQEEEALVDSEEAEKMENFSEKIQVLKDEVVATQDDSGTEKMVTEMDRVNGKMYVGMTDFVPARKEGTTEEISLSSSYTEPSERRENIETTSLTSGPRFFLTQETGLTYPSIEYLHSTQSSAFTLDDSRIGDDNGSRSSNFSGKAYQGSNYFQCRDIVQSILGEYKCNGILDCEDGTDEENCTCGAILLNTNPKLICNGRVNCPDLSDESNCTECPEGEFRCQTSEECVPIYERCNGMAACAFGEDEKNCMTLAKNGEIQLQDNGEPFLETEGILVINRQGVWTLECQEETSVLTAGSAIEVCSALGTIGYEKYENRSVTPNCTGFHVTCSENLMTSLEEYNFRKKGYIWPWKALVYSDGLLLCSAVLLQPRWLLTSKECFRNVSLKENYLAAKLGSKEEKSKSNEADGEIVRVDGFRTIPDSDVALLHLSRNINQTQFIRPLGLPYAFESDPEKDLCVVAENGQTVFLRISETCSPGARCYKKVGSSSANCKSKPWLGVVVCQSRFGWYPSSVFLEEAGHCGFQDVSFTSIREKFKIVHSVMGEAVEDFPEPPCDGFRCPLGFCIPRDKTCNGQADCPSGEDEDFHLCISKTEKKECKITELKCANGLCIPKVLFGDGTDDCGDNSDEPADPKCIDYLRLTTPERICDGKRNCYDKTDEDHRFCSCDQRRFKCKLSHHCIPRDFVCDGEKDCPSGEDEEQCMGRRIVMNNTKNRLEIMQKSFGIWHTACPSNVSKEHADALCRDLGYREATAYEKNQTVVIPKVDAFSWVKLNRRTSIALRGDNPFVSLLTLRTTCWAVKCF